jgi:hypothetical protein
LMTTSAAATCKRHVDVSRDFEWQSAKRGFVVVRLSLIEFEP